MIPIYTLEIDHFENGITHVMVMMMVGPILVRNYGPK
jgi:hypothetical protein